MGVPPSQLLSVQLHAGVPDGRDEEPARAQPSSSPREDAGLVGDRNVDQSEEADHSVEAAHVEGDLVDRGHVASKKRPFRH